MRDACTYNNVQSYLSLRLRADNRRRYGWLERDGSHSSRFHHHTRRQREHWSSQLTGFTCRVISSPHLGQGLEIVPLMTGSTLGLYAMDARLATSAPYTSIASFASGSTFDANYFMGRVLTCVCSQHTMSVQVSRIVRGIQNEPH